MPFIDLYILCQMEKMLDTSIFISFSCIVFKRLVLQTCKNLAFWERVKVVKFWVCLVKSYMKLSWLIITFHCGCLYRWCLFGNCCCTYTRNMSCLCGWCSCKIKNQICLYLPLMSSKRLQK